MNDWMFQANPKLYDLLGAAGTGFDDNWSMKVHRNKVAVGDRVFFLISRPSKIIIPHSRSWWRNCGSPCRSRSSEGPSRPDNERAQGRGDPQARHDGRTRTLVAF